VDKAKIQRAKVKTGKKQKSGKAAKMEKPAKGGKTKFLKKKAAYKGEMGLYVDLGLFDDTDGSKEGIAKWLKKELGEGPKLAAKLHAKLLKDGVVG
jgi:hypothetical protein